MTVGSKTGKSLIMERFVDIPTLKKKWAKSDFSWFLLYEYRYY